MLTDSIYSIVGKEQCSSDPEVLQKHSHDASTHPAVTPQLVVFPTSTKQVSDILKLANEQKVPVTVCGSQSSLEGNSIPSKNAVVLDMKKMNRVVEIIDKDFQVVVEPGILGDELNAVLANEQLYFPAFPASSHYATIGGMIANNAGGMYAVKYGVVGDWVMALEVVLADGSVIHTGSRSIKSVAGYDLTSLMTGSEGTLGVITRATLRVIPSVTSKLLILASFKTVHDALQATVDILHANIDPAAVEFLDAQSILYVNKYKSLSWNESPTILIELHCAATECSLKEAAIQNICNNYSSVSFTPARTREEQNRIWEGRKAVHPSIMASIPHAGIVPGDIGVPISAIPRFMQEVETVSKHFGVPTATFGHIGDGNFHVWMAYDRTNSSTLEKARAAGNRLVDFALSLNGTCTAEHGVGIGKRQYLAIEHADSILVMRQIKAVLDPLNILNPGKMFL